MRILSTTTYADIKDLEPYTRYELKISAATKAGEGPFQWETLQTDEDGKSCFLGYNQGDLNSPTKALGKNNFRRNSQVEKGIGKANTFKPNINCFLYEPQHLTWE